jgi:hypothetical protein
VVTVPAAAADDGGTPPQASAAAPAATGTLTGVVTVRTTGKPLPGVKVSAGGVNVTTDAEGRFTLPLPPGRYDVRLASLAYQPTVLAGVEVAGGTITTANAALNPAVVARSSANLDVIEVYGEVTRASEATQVARRLAGAAVSETVSAETIRKLPASDVAQVAKRVPSVTVVRRRTARRSCASAGSATATRSGWSTARCCRAPTPSSGSCRRRSSRPSSSIRSPCTIASSRTCGETSLAHRWSSSCASRRTC